MTTLLQRIGWGREKSQDNRAESFARYEDEMKELLNGSQDLEELHRKYGYDEATRVAGQLSVLYDQHLVRIGDEKTRAAIAESLRKFERGEYEGLSSYSSDEVPTFCSKCQRPYTEWRCPRCK